ncbi:MAG: J domain-containing protein [Deltaproteobacteria bacterium]|nr:J domain-containing protein [Deltaproteobacteria bacterium]
MPVADAAAQADLLKACRIIFGNNVSVTIDFLHYVQLVGLKAAYRKKAFETHPDRARAMGTYEAGMTEKFKRVREAYELLHNYLSKKPLRTSLTAQARTARKEPAVQQPHSRAPGAARVDHFYNGRMPNRTLLIGQFLYYSGAVSWKTLIAAISWQRRQRPRIGQLAVDWGLLSSQEILCVLSGRTSNEKFGECATRMGYISSLQQIALVGKQRRMQRPIGHFFVHAGVVLDNDLPHILSKQKMHNRNVFNCR